MPNLAIDERFVARHWYYAREEVTRGVVLKARPPSSLPAK